MDSYTGKSKEEQLALHRAYYGQLVGESTIRRVVSVIGEKRLMASTDPWLNDIPLKEWDRLTASLPLAQPFKNLEDYATLAGLVCVAKEAAHQFIERNRK